METLCGMLNGRGGVVVFGVNNKGKILGQEVSDKTTREIGDALGRFDPSVDVQPQYIRLNDSNKYLIAFCSNGMESDKPYMWDGKPYQRHDSVTTVMPRERFLRLYEEQTGLTYKWERKVNTQLTVASLDEDLIRNVVNGGIRRGRLSGDAQNDDIITILNRLKLLHNGEVRNSAAILFGKDLADYPQVLVRLARFRGVDKKDFIDNRQISGNIFELASGVMDFFFKHLSLAGSTHKRMERDDKLEIPYDALREAIVNALCHRAWQQEASTIGIAIYDNRVEIENAGRFPAPLSPERLFEDASGSDNTSLPPNPDIANVMFIGGLIEHWGRGLSMMKSECEKSGLEKPLIIDNGFMVKVIFTRPDKNEKVAIEEQPDNNRITVGKQQDISRITPKEEQYRKNGKRRTVRERRKSLRITVAGQIIYISSFLIRLIIAIGEDHLTGRELRNKMGYKSKSTFWTNYLAPALKKGILALENEESPKSPNQRYALTTSGRKLLSVITAVRSNNSPVVCTENY